MEEERSKKIKLSLDSRGWSKLLDSKDDDGDPPALVVTKTGADLAESDSGESDRLAVELMSDSQLVKSIEKQKNTYASTGSKLPDKGQKIKDVIKKLEMEKERRERNPRKIVKVVELFKDNNRSDTLSHSQNSSVKAPSIGVKQVAPPSGQSEFGVLFCQKFEKDQANRAAGAFQNQLKALGRCDRLKTRPNGQVSPKEKQSILRSRKNCFQSPGLFSGDGKKKYTSNVAVHTSSSSSDMEENPSRCLSRRNSSKVYPSNNSRPTNQVHTVVLLDEESQHVDKIDEEEKVDEGMKGTTIYYPSRDHPDSVEICYTDMECLAPETYLTSTIMNFYIRYLQRAKFTTDDDRGRYHFFTTYFYEKLKVAVQTTKYDMEEMYAKFRRWWKGINLFEKAYIFLPIHENHHWSLVIICIPDKEDECGPILLHLDSLGFHISTSIFENIKRFLKKEWAYLKEKETSSNNPIADRIWNILPQRIEEKVIMVPQQKNDYDCGLFVLFFIQRFIEDAPQRLKKKDIARFGKQWFSPKEASDLRPEIRALLKNMFRESRVIEV